MKYFVRLALFAASCCLAGSAFAYCNPQCVDWARNNSNVDIPRLGNSGVARDIPNRVRNDPRFKITDKPSTGAIMVIDTNVREGHVVAIQDSDKKDDGKYSLRITHANFTYKSSGKCDTESNVKATYDRRSGEVKFRSGYWNGKTFHVIAIVKAR